MGLLMRKRLWGVLALGLVVFYGCQGEPQKWPGPCKGEWVVRESIEIGGVHFVVPIEQGETRTMRFLYDEAGRWVGVEDDDNSDGVLESRIEVAYDDQGRPALERIDRGADGTHDVERLFQYGADGSVTASIQIIHEDGTVETRTEAGAVPHPPVFSRCFGECEYDDWGNILSDRDRHGQDTLKYAYGCWR